MTELPECDYRRSMMEVSLEDLEELRALEERSRFQEAEINRLSTLLQRENLRKRHIDFEWSWMYEYAVDLDRALNAFVQQGSFTRPSIEAGLHPAMEKFQREIENKIQEVHRNIENKINQIRFDQAKLKLDVVSTRVSLLNLLERMKERRKDMIHVKKRSYSRVPPLPPILSPASPVREHAEYPVKPPQLKQQESPKKANQPGSVQSSPGKSDQTKPMPMRHFQIAAPPPPVGDHKDEEDLSKRFWCNCGKYYKQWSALRRHQFIFSYGDIFKCKICPRTFTTHPALRLHVQTKHKLKYRENFGCRFCGETFVKFHQLRDHHAKVHGLKRVKIRAT